MNKTLSFVLFISILTGLGAAELPMITPTQKMPPEKACPTGEMNILKDVNLTTEQISKIKQFRQQMRERTTPESKENPLTRYTQNGSFDKVAFTNIANQKSQQRNMAEAEYFEKIYTILTPDQKNKIKTIYTEK